jgi:hypothetical protein
MDILKIDNKPTLQTEREIKYENTTTHITHI